MATSLPDWPQRRYPQAPYLDWPLSTGVPRTLEEKAAGKVNLSSSDSPYHYTKVTYSQEDVDKLLRLTHYNICNNQERLREALRQAVQRRKQRTQRTQRRPE